MLSPTLRLPLSLMRTATCTSLRHYTPAALNAVETSDEHPPGWAEARPFTSIPGPSRLAVLRSYLPGGYLHRCEPREIQRRLRQRYGPLVRLPGLWGQRDALFSFNPASFEHVFRTEGAWPRRRSLEVLEYYRQQRPERFAAGLGLVSDQGESWQRMRSAVQPVLMAPKTARSYVPGVDRVAGDFVRRVGELRDERSEMPADFYKELSFWSLESIGWIALDRRLNVMMTAERTKEADEFFESISDLFQLSFDLQVRPSIWRYYSTKKYRQFFASVDKLTDFLAKYVDEAIVNIEENRSTADENTILRKLLKKDRDYAFITALDMMLAGVDTTASAAAMLLYRLAINPEQQEKLRGEIFRAQPEANEPLTSEHLEAVPYFKACLRESMRLFPRVPENPRSTGKNIILDGYRVPKHTDIFMANALMQTSEEYCERSLDFVPERWLRGCPEAELKIRHPFVCLPFGYGPRMCIGKRYAEMEIQILVTRLLQKYRIEWHNGPMKCVASIVVLPGTDLKLRFLPL